jgi:hypothetical protein
MDGNAVEFLPGNPYVNINKDTHLAIVPFAKSQMILENGKLSNIGGGVVDQDYSSYLLSASKNKLLYKLGVSIPGFNAPEYENKLQAGLEYLPFKADNTPLSPNNQKIIFDDKRSMKVVVMDNNEIGRIRGNQLPIDSKAIGPTSPNINEVSAGGQNPKFKEFNPTRNVRYQGIKGDVLSHEKNPVTMYLFDNKGMREVTEETVDDRTATHEAEHGANADLSRPYGENYQGFYLGNNKAAYVKTPYGTQLSDLANYVPDSLKGSRYKTYILQIQPETANIPRQPGVIYEKNKNPLYILNELWAYNMGAKAGIESPSKNSVDGVGEFAGFSLAMGQAIKERSPQYWSSQDGEQLKNFLRISLEDSMKILNQARSTGIPIQPLDTSALNNLRTNRDSEGLRQFSRQNLGADWTKQVLGF